MKSARFLPLWTAVLALSALQCTSTTGPSGLPFDTLSYSREGGLIGGLVFQVDITSIGMVTVKRSSGLKLGRITSQERDSLIVISQGYTQWADSAQIGGCADCFFHHFTISGSGGTKAVLYDDAGLSGPGPDAPAVRRLVDVLGSIAARLSPQTIE